MNATQTTPQRAHLNHDQVENITGRMESAVVARIIATGANESELLEAFERFMRPGEVAEETHRPLTGVVAEVYDILCTTEPQFDEDRERG